MDFELTRAENDEKLLSQIDSIKTAENIQVLIPFAKAYLGMFYVIDKELAVTNDCFWHQTVIQYFILVIRYTGINFVEVCYACNRCPYQRTRACSL